MKEISVAGPQIAYIKHHSNRLGGGRSAWQIFGGSSPRVAGRIPGGIQIPVFASGTNRFSSFCNGALCARDRWELFISFKMQKFGQCYEFIPLIFQLVYYHWKSLNRIVPVYAVHQVPSIVQVNYAAGMDTLHDVFVYFLWGIDRIIVIGHIVPSNYAVMHFMNDF